MGLGDARRISSLGPCYLFKRYFQAKDRLRGGRVLTKFWTINAKSAPPWRKRVESPLTSGSPSNSNISANVKSHLKRFHGIDQGPSLFFCEKYQSWKICVHSPFPVRIVQADPEYSWRCFQQHWTSQKNYDIFKRTDCIDVYAGYSTLLYP
jgi:hypothetical protein